jgi:hypothetical protein
MRRVDEQYRPLAAFGLIQPGAELVAPERRLLRGIRFGRDRPDLAPAETEFFFKKARTWDSPRRLPVRRSMASCASAVERGGCSRK